MSSHNICLYKELDKKYTGCNLKTKELLDCVLIEVSAVIRSNTVCFHSEIRKIIGGYPSYLEIGPLWFLGINLTLHNMSL